MRKSKVGLMIAGLAAGSINGLFGAGGGMVLVPLLSLMTPLQEDEIFPASVSIILPICLVSLFFTGMNGSIAWAASVPYLIGSALGGILSGALGKRIPVVWLHRVLGILIIWGGFRYLC